MSEPKTAFKPLPNFKSQAEEDAFWKENNWKDYADQYTASYFKNSQAFNSPQGPVSEEIYIERDTVNDTNLTENVNVRFDKKTVEELWKLAGHDGRTLASLVRKWVLEKMKEYKYSHGL